MASRNATHCGSVSATWPAVAAAVVMRRRTPRARRGPLARSLAWEARTPFDSPGRYELAGKFHALPAFCQDEGATLRLRPGCSVGLYFPDFRAFLPSALSAMRATLRSSGGSDRSSPAL